LPTKRKNRVESKRRKERAERRGSEVLPKRVLPTRRSEPD
jgi:hypothetical protein